MPYSSAWDTASNHIQDIPSMRTIRPILLAGALPLLVFLLFLLLPADPVVPTESRAELGLAPPDTAVVGLFKRECSSCHGVDGKGQTRAGKRAGTKDFTDAEYQAGWTDEEAAEVIRTSKKDGKQLKNKKPFAEKLTAAQIDGLISHVRSFAETGS